MLTQIPENIEDDINNSNSELPPETIRYLSEVENKLYADIASRRRIDSGLLFLSCQISSCSLSWLLFHLQVTLLIIQVSSMVVSLLPGLIDIGDSFTFQISSENWKLDLGNKPIIGLTKLAIGGAVSASGTSKITSEIIQTQQAIAQTVFGLGQSSVMLEQEIYYALQIMELLGRVLSHHNQRQET